MRRTILLAGVVSFVMAFLGTALALLLAGPAMVSAQEARIRAEQFIVTAWGPTGALRHAGVAPRHFARRHGDGRRTRGM
jgi:hypothetical protein